MATVPNVITAAALGTRTVQGGCLFDIAAEAFGDATQWYRIAALNGLDDPFLPESTILTLVIPPPVTTGGNGGILGV